MDVLDDIMGDFQKEVVFAINLNKDYRGLCGSCKEAILNEKYVQLAALPGAPIDSIKPLYHESCYENKVLPRCHTCHQSIRGEILSTTSFNVSADMEKPRTFHPLCFRCVTCEKSVGNQRYYKSGEKQGPVCIACYEEENLPTCNGCAKKINSGPDSVKAEWLTVGDQKLHRECFACQTCKTPFTDLKAYSANGKFYCKDHVQEAMKLAADAEKNR